MRGIELRTMGPSGDCGVLRVAGEVDVDSASALRERTLDLVAAGAVHIVIDLGGVTFIDSSGLGVLVGCLKRLRERDGSLTLVIDADRVLRVFEITGLTKVFLRILRLRRRSPVTGTGGRRSRPNPGVSRPGADSTAWRRAGRTARIGRARARAESRY